MGSAADLPTLAAGARVAGYEIDKLRGIGGFGAVYRARDGAGNTVALKVLHRELFGDAEAAARFRIEAEAIERVEHPAVVRVLESGATDDGLVYIAMAWIDGITLRRQLRSRGPLSLRRTGAILDVLCDALGAAHAAGVVHRDVKSSNLMLTARGDDVAITLLDFGIAKLFERHTGEPLPFTGTGASLGSPHAMAPEQFCGGPVDPRTDVYGTGVLIYEMLTGAVPFVADDPADLRALHFEQSPPRVSRRAAVPRAVDDVVRRCMAKLPDDRYPSVAELARAFAAAAAEPVTDTTPPEPGEAGGTTPTRTARSGSRD